MQLLRLRGWKAYHTFDSRRSEPGFPDIIAIRGHVLVALELKSARGRVTEAQADWLRAFARVLTTDAIVLRAKAPNYDGGPMDFGELGAYLEQWEAPRG